VAEALDGREPAELYTRAPGAARSSAVLVPVYEEGGETYLLLTRRSPHLRTHRWEVAFPGGRQDPGETLERTALREAEEEVALDTSVVELIGQLDKLRTVSSNSGIVPFVGRLPGRPHVVPNPAEVEKVLHVPVSELTADGVYREERWRWPDDDELRSVYFFELIGDTVWGATANLVRQLLVLGLGL
jgi:8-oxo-dGTP pyrophosphatase MutT (NUDIX family)